MSPKPANNPSRREEQLSSQIGRLYYQFLGFQEKALARAGLDDLLQPGMIPVLCCLYEKDNPIIKEIASRACLSYSTLTATLAKMEKNGLVKRTSCGQDGRATRVRLTKKGKGLESRLRDYSREVEKALRKGLTAAQVKSLVKRFSILQGNMRTEGIVEG